MTADLSTPARQALIMLMVSVAPVSNPELRQAYRTEVGKAARDELTKKRLITWEKGARNAIFCELTDEGWVRARQEFQAPAPERVSGAWLLHYATLRHLASLLDRADLKIADLFAAPDPGPGGAAAEDTSPSVARRILGAYEELVEAPGGFVLLAPVRARLSDVPREELDETLTAMALRHEIHLEPDPARGNRTRDELDAAVLVAGEAKHMITIGQA